MLNKILGWIFRFNFKGMIIEDEPVLAYVWRVKLDGTVDKFLTLAYLNKPNPTYKPIQPPVHPMCRCMIPNEPNELIDYDAMLRGELSAPDKPLDISKFINLN